MKTSHCAFQQSQRDLLRLLDEIGAWAGVDNTRIGTYETMQVWDESSSADSGDALRFDAAEFAAAQLGFIVENVMLQTALLDVLQKSDVQLLFDTPIESLSLREQGPQLQLEDGRRARC